MEDRNLIVGAVIMQGGSMSDVNRVLQDYKEWLEKGGTYQDFLDYGISVGKSCPTCVN